MKRILTIFVIIMTLGCQSPPSPPEESESVPEESEQPVDLEEPENTPDARETPRILLPLPREPDPEPLTQSDLIRLVEEALLNRYIILEDEAGPAIYFLDLNADGYDDIYAYCLERDTQVTDYTLRSLSQTDRLYSEDASNFTLHIPVLMQQEGRLVLTSVQEIPSRRVFESHQIVPLSLQQAVPSVLVLDFGLPDGNATELLLLHQDGTISHMTIRNAMSEALRFSDLDDDMRLDIIVFRSSVNTQVFWYSWDETGFTLEESSNVLEKYIDFLEIFREILQTENWEDLLSFLPNSQYGEPENRNDWITLLDALFYPVSPEEQPDFSYLLDDDISVQNVYFPEFYEVPFTIQDDGSYEHVLYFRVVTSAGERLFFTTALQLSSNPFRFPVFVFTVR
ncbi:MAG: hypothetical protein ACLFR1_12230 [Spirochaetia bacterium]